MRTNLPHGTGYIAGAIMFVTAMALRDHLGEVLAWLISAMIIIAAMTLLAFSLS